MSDRQVVVRDGNGSVAMVAIIAVVVIGLAVALFVWQPWNSNASGTHNSTTINAPANPGAGGAAGSSGSGKSGSSGSSSSGSSNK
jgi:hypothetical protein